MFVEAAAELIEILVNARSQVRVCARSVATRHHFHLGMNRDAAKAENKTTHG
jgi:hypothetical protein